LFARRAGRVYAFEPHPRNIRYLHRTLELNRVRNVTVVPFAVGDQTGPSAFQEGEHSSTGHLAAGGSLPAFAISLDEFITRYEARPGLLKIDVEGGELGVLEGGRAFLREHRPPLLLSTHGEALKEGCLRLCRELGYARVEPLNGGLADATDLCLEA